MLLVYVNDFRLLARDETTIRWVGTTRVNHGFGARDQPVNLRDEESTCLKRIRRQ